MTSRMVLGLLVALSTSAGCAHTRSVGDNESAPSESASARDDGRADRPSGHVADPVSPAARDGAPPLATSPAALLEPGALRTVQEKLSSRGELSQDDESGKLDEPTRRALRSFQRKSGLPATGMPDDVTVQKLGLDPGKIFRSTKR
jgi:peptidoglycan hydrolase-like protein with peptidoglycan-binding domain